MQQRSAEAPFARTIEWPTLLTAVAVYGAFGLVTWYYHQLAWWLVLPLGGYIVAWHGSLQHEAVHGHPTRWRWLNEALVYPSLWLWMPFRSYRTLHLTHHRNDRLTDPLKDPESYYVTATRWAQFGPLRRAVLRANNSLLGRLVIGPWVAAIGYWRDELRALRDGSGRTDGWAWVHHLLGSALVLAWVVGLCGIPLWEYVLLFVYPGLSLTLLRSFLEHRARGEVSERTVIVEAEAPIALMFLNNNLHAVHHEHPGAAWYRLPAIYKTEGPRLVRENGGYLFKGYREVFRRYFLRAKEPVVHPASL
jgi:fatty acid desaturase